MAKKKAVEKETRNFYDCPAEKFVRVWQESESVQEVVEKSGMPYDIVLARVCSYRRKGLNLKKMKRANSRRTIDVKDLNRLIEEAQKQKGQSNETQAVINAVLPDLMASLKKTLEKKLTKLLPHE